jgi:hypothetical protein
VGGVSGPPRRPRDPLRLRCVPPGPPAGPLADPERLRHVPYERLRPVWPT